MKGFRKEYYQKMIQTDTQDVNWTQFELDLIRCVRERYPIIYTKIGDMTRHQRAGKIRSAWKQISNEFCDLPLTYIKARWRSILDNYLKVKIYADSTPGFNEVLVKNKFIDGTLSFLEGEVDLFNDHHKPKKAKVSKSHNTDEEPSDDESANAKSYVLDIRETLHEEVDLDEDALQVKMEVGDNNYNIETVKESTIPDHTINDGATNEPKNGWSDEELLNATRLTKEMIDQLIIIKTREYYMAPVVPK